MVTSFFITSTVTVLAIVASLCLARFYFTNIRPTESLTPEPPINFPEPADYVKELARELPDSVVFPRNEAAFRRAMEGYWSQQNRDMIPACVVQPRDTQELSIAVKHLQREHTSRLLRRDQNGLFAIRSGGANPAFGISGVKNGVVLDLSLLNEVTPSKDGSSVVVGAGAYWVKVYAELEKRNLAVVGGRSSPVGVGGSTLQGGMSFYSPKHGFICSNVLSYEVVLADGSILKASADEHPDLWRALKGGGNNFGVVSRFTYKAFPAGDVWAGSFIGFGFEATKTLKALHDYVKLANDPMVFDERASVPIVSAGYSHDYGVTAFHTHLVYTEPSPSRDWPEYWKKSPFRTLWRFRNAFKNQSLSSAVTSLGSLSPSGLRNVYGTTTIKNDFKTILAVHQIWKDHIPLVKHAKGGLFCLILQPLLPQWVNKGQPNVLGLDDCQEPLIVVSFALSWCDPKEDKALPAAVRKAIAAIEKAAIANHASHPYRFMNYATEMQRPLDGYGVENMDLMRRVSRRYDPQGLFQTGCLGGHKLEEPSGHI
ncbi:FAD-dependent monooxygenase CTB5 [Paramyrothecium foliicola]|nr:FAD-dependent monooxygenase CTB5 [Paramyrothecium foliicola]